MTDEERIEQLELEIKVLLANNKGLKDKIDEQSKEIEELKEDNKHQWEERCKLTFELENSTSNDKIKAKIEELENEKEKYFEKQVIQHEIAVLQSLLEKE